MSLSVIPLVILGQITGVSGSGDATLYQMTFKDIEGTPLYGVSAVWTDEQAEIEALAAQKPYGVWINPIDGTFTVKFAGYEYVGSADLTDADVLAGVTPIQFENSETSDRLLPEVDSEDAGKTVVVSDEGQWEVGSALPIPGFHDMHKALIVNEDEQWTMSRITTASINSEDSLNEAVLISNGDGSASWATRSLIKVYRDQSITSMVNAGILSMTQNVILNGSDSYSFTLNDSQPSTYNSLLQAIDNSTTMTEMPANSLEKGYLWTISLFVGLAQYIYSEGVINKQVTFERIVHISGSIVRFTAVFEVTNSTTITVYLYGKKLT